MDLESSHLKIVLILTVGFFFAAIFGCLSQRFRLSPIVGYLLAGYIIGPFSPGFVADISVAEQLAEIGVILMMFGVGMHFEWKDLVNVKNIAIPGAILQTLGATVSSALFLTYLGWPIETGIIIGLAVGVASTVVLMRVLSDNGVLNTPQGHISVGWLIVEDILTVTALMLLPTFAEAFKGDGFSYSTILVSVVIALVKFVALLLFMSTIGIRVVTWVLSNVARTRSSELFTLSVLALIFVIATLSSFVFGASIALGAFIAGMVLGQTDVRHQVSVNSVPLKDTFVVLFFLSVGMLFNPAVISANPYLFAGLLAIILLIKPLIAIVVTLALKYPLKSALTVGLALSQIGEFSFILAEESLKLGLIPDDGYDLIVACALTTIAINPVIFKQVNPLTKFFQGNYHPPVEEDSEILNLDSRESAIIVGYGPIGQNASRFLKAHLITPVIIDQNIDTIARLLKEGEVAVFGDAANPKILDIARIKEAQLLIITAPEIEVNLNVIKATRSLNPTIQILARTQFKSDIHLLNQNHVDYVCNEEESIGAFDRKLEELISATN